MSLGWVGTTMAPVWKGDGTEGGRSESEASRKGKRVRTRTRDREEVGAKTRGREVRTRGDRDRRRDGSELGGNRSHQREVSQKQLVLNIESCKQLSRY